MAKSDKDLSEALSGNRLLDAVPAYVRGTLLSERRQITLQTQETLYLQHEPVPFVYFPTTAVISLISVMEEGRAIEAAAVGREGMVGIHVFFDGNLAQSNAIAQVPGEIIRVPARIFETQIAEHQPFNNLVRRYARTLVMQLFRSAGCNSLHSSEQRLARWLLMLQDRAKTDEFHLTQEFLTEVLGVHRPRVTAVALSLQQAGLIQYRRGRIKVLDRRGLRHVACECYQILKEDLDRLLK